MNAETGIRATIVVALLTAFSAGAHAQRSAEFERTFAVTGPLELDVATGSGDITVRASTGDTARVIGRLQIDDGADVWSFWRRGARVTDEEARELIRRFEEEPPAELSGGRLRVGHIDEEWQHGFSVSYEVEVPQATDISARTGSGRADIDGIEGRIVARTGSGSVTLRDIIGDVEARSGSGSIRAEALAGRFDGRAGSGSIDVDLVSASDVAVATGSGRINVSGLDGALSARAGSGSITIDGLPSDSWDLTSGSGTIRLRLPGDSAFSVDARAGSGGVSTEHPLTITGTIDRHRIQGQVRGGGPLISARSGSGGIRIE